MSEGITIIKKKKVSGGDGHHGGAWKVAYADFVTAMMAFFMLMWLLNATTETQRKGLADYFSPTIAVARVSGGGDGAFGGDSMTSEETLAQSGNGGIVTGPPGSGSAEESGPSEKDAQEEEMLKELQEGLVGRGGESLIAEMALEHIVTKITDEGLIIEVFDLEGDPLFEGVTAEPTPVLIEIAKILGDVFALVKNEVSVAAHSATFPVVQQSNPAWNLTTDRAQRVRQMLQATTLEERRIARVTGFGQQNPLLDDAMAVRNNRLEIILLRDNG